MKIQIKPQLTKTKQPTSTDLRNKIGECVQVLGDGFCLVEFDVKGRKLHWYIYDTDFFIKQ